MQIDWETVKPGDNLPELKKKPGITQLVKYAAGGGDFNPLHHDRDSKQAKAIGSVIVHGRYKYASLGELASNWLGHQGFIREIYCQYRGMDHPDQEMTCKGLVEEVQGNPDRRTVKLSLWVENEDGQKTTIGSAVVSNFPPSEE